MRDSGSGAESPQRPAVDLSIIVVNYNTRALLEKCLRSIDEHVQGRMTCEVHVVDNASTDGSAEWLRAEGAAIPGVVVHLMGENLGFARANNVGIAAARGRQVLLLNSDAYFVDGSLASAMAYLDGHPEVFALACMLLTADGRPGASYGRFPHLATVALEILTLRFNRLRAVSPEPGPVVRDVDFPCGAFFLMRADALAKVGLLDGRYFMYFEETDLARRARDLGYHIRYFGAAQAVHIGGGSSEGPGNPFLIETFYRSWGMYLLRHHGALHARLVFLLLLAHHSAATALRALLGRSRGAAWFRVRRDGLWRARGDFLSGGRTSSGDRTEKGRGAVREA